MVAINYLILDICRYKYLLDAGCQAYYLLLPKIVGKRVFVIGSFLANWFVKFITLFINIRIPDRTANFIRYLTKSLLYKILATPSKTATNHRIRG